MIEEKFQFRNVDEIKKDTFMYQIERMILILKIDCDIVASPWNKEKTIEWYMKEYGIDRKEDLDVSYVDIRHECMIIPVSPEDEDYEDLQYLYYIDGFKELILNDVREKKDNIVLFEGELHRNITIEEYCTNCLEHGNKMKHPEVIASSEI